jgi:hypothetical protein
MDHNRSVDFGLPFVTAIVGTLTPVLTASAFQVTFVNPIWGYAFALGPLLFYEIFGLSNWAMLAALPVAVMWVLGLIFFMGFVVRTAYIVSPILHRILTVVIVVSMAFVVPDHSERFMNASLFEVILGT